MAVWGRASEQDAMVIRELIKNPKASYTDLAEKLNMNRTEVADRITKIEKNNMIKEYRFWNIDSAYDSTWYFEIHCNSPNEALDILRENYELAFSWFDNKSVVYGVILSWGKDMEKDFRERLKHTKIRSMSLKKVEFNQFMDRKIIKEPAVITDTTKKVIESLVSEYASTAMVDAVFRLKQKEKNSDIELLVLKNPKLYTSEEIRVEEKMIDNLWVHFKILNSDVFRYGVARSNETYLQLKEGAEPLFVRDEFRKKAKWLF
ncbi:MAG: AsnC family protein [Candidatus Diapherotrites archaeon]|nr:AsnC family protein [Candidatus Diapherotrites archaeon]